MNSLALRYSVRKSSFLLKKVTSRRMFYSSLFSHDSQFAAYRLRKKYNQQIAVRTFCKDESPNGMVEDNNNSLNESATFETSDVTNEVRESIDEQLRMEKESWGSSEEIQASKKSIESETNKSVDDDNAKSFINNLFEHQKQQPIFKGSGGKIVDPTSPEEMKSFVEQCDQAIKELEEGLEKNTIPFYMRSISRRLLKTVKYEKEEATKIIKESEGAAGETTKSEAVANGASKSEEVVNEATKSDTVAGESSKGGVANGATKSENVFGKSSKSEKDSGKSSKSETTSSEAGKSKPESDKKPNEKPGKDKSDEQNGFESYQKMFKEKATKMFSGEDNKGLASLFLYGGLILGVIGFVTMGSKKDNKVTYDEFMKEFLLKGHIKEIMVGDGGKVFIELLDSFDGHNGKDYTHEKNGQPFYYTFDIPDASDFMKNVEEMELELGIDREDFVPMSFKNAALGKDPLGTIMSILMLVIFASIFLPMGRGKGGMGNMMTKAMGLESKNIEIVKQTGVTFKDVAGIDEAKTEIMEFIDFLKNSDKYAALGAKLPKGAILTGPPGTGKTLLVKAAAGEANVPFISMSGSDFVELFVGMGAKRVRELFAEARKNAPCIVFIDEIDAIGKKRNEGKFSGSNDEREQTLNQILIEMDGFKPRDGITIFAGTNRVDVLDPALLRAGRFDRHIAVDKPDIRGRKEIAKIYLSKIKFEGDLDEMAQKLAEMTPGYTGADICNIVNEAAIIAIRNKHDVVQLIDLIGAVDRILCGMEKKQSIMTPSEKRRIAYHEAGHAVIGWMSEHVDPMLKVTIVPRANGALGFTQNLPKEIPLYSQDEMSEMLVQLMGGRAAEKLFCGNMTTGASDDLNKATKLAYGMVAGYGFNDEVGPVNYQQEDESFQKPYSESTGKSIDDEARKILKESMKKALAMLDENKEKMVKVAELLLERETITSVDMEAICGQRRGRSPTSYSNIIRDVQESEKEKEEKKEDSQEQDPSSEDTNKEATNKEDI